MTRATATIINKKSIEYQIAKQINDISIRFINELAADLLLEIFKLTNQGMNAYNKPFIPYSENYRLQRLEKGLGSQPNMQQTSTMINSLIIKRKDNHSLRIGPHGSSKGISNSFKLAILKQKKNYVILAWSEHYKKLLSVHLRRYQQRFSNIKF